MWVEGCATHVIKQFMMLVRHWFSFSSLHLPKQSCVCTTESIVAVRFRVGALSWVLTTVHACFAGTQLTHSPPPDFLSGGRDVHSLLCLNAPGDEMRRLSLVDALCESQLFCDFLLGCPSASTCRNRHLSPEKQPEIQTCN